MSPTPVETGPSLQALTVTNHVVQPVTLSKANGNALGITTPFANPVTVDLSVDSGSLSVGGGDAVSEFVQTYDSAADATAALDGLQYIPDDTFTGVAMLTFTATTELNGVAHNAVETIPLAIPNTHLVVTQTESDTPTDPNTVSLTITVSNPGGPDDQDGTNVMVQNYLTPGLTIVSSTASQGTFDPTTRLWNIGTLPVSATGMATLTLTLQADPSTYDTPLTNVADASSDLINYPATDATSLVSVTPLANLVVISPSTLPGASLKVPYFEQITADRGGGGPYTYTLTGTVPNGVYLAPNGA